MEEELKSLIKKNEELSKEILKSVKYIKRYIVINQIFGAIKIFIIVVPLILGVMYLPKIIRENLSKYERLFKGMDFISDINNTNTKSKIDLNNLSKKEIEQIKNFLGSQ